MASPMFSEPFNHNFKFVFPDYFLYFFLFPKSFFIYLMNLLLNLFCHCWLVDWITFSIAIPYKNYWCIFYCFCRKWKGGRGWRGPPAQPSPQLQRSLHHRADLCYAARTLLIHRQQQQQQQLYTVKQQYFTVQLQQHHTLLYTIQAHLCNNSEHAPVPL